MRHHIKKISFWTALCSSLSLAACSTEPLEQKDSIPENPLAQIEWIDHIADSNPAELQAICPQLTDPQVRSHCDHRYNRVHLSQRKPSGEKIPISSNKGEIVQDDLIGLHQIQHPILAHTPTDSVIDDCPEKKGPCIIQRVRTRFEQQDSLDALIRLCKEISDTKWRSECAFVLADFNVVEGGQGPRPVPDAPWMDSEIFPINAERVRASTQLCLESGIFISECFDHISGIALAYTPLADEPEEAWADILRFVAQSTAILKAASPHIGAQYEAYLWSIIVNAAFVEESECTGRARSWLPETALPHVRLSIARDSLRRHPDLAWPERLERAQQCYELKTGLSDVRSSRPSVPNIPRWQRLWPQGSQDAWTFFVGLRKRRTSSNPETDWQLAFAELYLAQGAQLPEELRSAPAVEELLSHHSFQGHGQRQGPHRR